MHVNFLHFRNGSMVVVVKEMDSLLSLIGKEMGMNIKINTVGQRLGHYMNIFIRDAAKSCLQGNERTRRHPVQD